MMEYKIKVFEHICDGKRVCILDGLKPEEMQELKERCNITDKIPTLTAEVPILNIDSVLPNLVILSGNAKRYSKYYEITASTLNGVITGYSQTGT